MKSLGQRAYETWWGRFHKVIDKSYMRPEPWAKQSKNVQETWDYMAEALTQEVFDRLGEVLDEGDEEPEVKETA